MDNFKRRAFRFVRTYETMNLAPKRKPIVDKFPGTISVFN